MGKIVRKGVEYGGSSNSADCIKYNDTKSVKTAIDDIKNTAMFIDSFDTNTGTLNTTSVSASSSSNPTAASVTFDNTDTGLNATNVQDAVTEVNGKLDKNEYEHGSYNHPVAVSTKDIIKISIKFKNTHKIKPNAILVSYRTYDYFYGELHVDVDTETTTGFDCIYIPKDIGNGRGTLIVDWVAFWD